MGLLTILKKVKEEEHEIRILVLGLDNAGKTTIVKRLCGQSINEIEPTLGFTIHTLDYNTNTNNSNSNSSSNSKTSASNNTSNIISTNTDATTTTADDTNNVNKDTEEEEEIDQIDDQENYKLHLWDIGGQSTIRAYWRNYFEKTDGIIWVVDSNDRQRLQLVRSELSTILKQERLAGASLLIMANKNDLQGALTTNEIGGRNGLRLQEELLQGQTNTRHWKIQGCSAVTKTGLSEGIDWLVNDITDRIFFTG